MSYYRLAGVHDKMQNWELALQNYLHSFNMRPHRAEPIVRIAQHYWNAGEFAPAFLFACAACEIPYPSGDILFIERNVYDYTRYDVLGCAAWYLGKYEKGLWAVEHALEIHPDYSHLLGNLALSKGQLGL